MVNKTNIFALVGGGKTPRYPKNKLMIWDDCNFYILSLGIYKCIAEISCKSELKSVKIRIDRCIAIL
jgi:hypothetical protein